MRCEGRPTQKTQREEKTPAQFWFPLLFFLLPLNLPYVNWASQEGCLFYLRSSLWSLELPLFYFHGLFPSLSFSRHHFGLLFPILLFSCFLRFYICLFGIHWLKRLPPMQEAWLRSLGQEDPLEKEMAIHSSILAWRIPWTEEPGRLQSTGSQRVGHD